MTAYISNREPSMTRVLVVEDDPDQREIYSALLYYNGYDVAEASSMIDAIHKSESFQPDVILLDVVLPDGNSLDRIDALSHASHGKPIICMTAHDVEPLRATRAGCADLLAKPLNGFDLVMAVERALRDHARRAG